jgi:hypothetical protein
MNLRAGKHRSKVSSYEWLDVRSGRGLDHRGASTVHSRRRIGRRGHEGVPRIVDVRRPNFSLPPKDPLMARAPLSKGRQRRG